MALYYFHLTDRDAVVDDEGVELSTLDAARCLAAEFFGSAIRDAGMAFFADHDWRLEVTDGRGLVLFVATAFTQDAAALQGSALQMRHATG